MQASITDLHTAPDGRVTLYARQQPSALQRDGHVTDASGGNQEVWSADLVVGADGSGSMVRRLVAAHDGAYAGYVGWRGWFPEEAAPAAAREAVGGCFAVCKVRSQSTQYSGATKRHKNMLRGLVPPHAA